MGRIKEKAREKERNQTETETNEQTDHSCTRRTILNTRCRESQRT